MTAATDQVFRGSAKSGTLYIFKGFAIGTIVFQLILCLTLQAFQVCKVKGAMKIYLLFEFLSVFLVNTSFYLKIRVTERKFNLLNYEMSDIIYQDKNPTDITNITKMVDGDTFLNQALSTETIDLIHDLFITIRKSFVVLIVYDVYNLICKPFDFRDFTKKKAVVKRSCIAIVCSVLVNLLSITRLTAHLFHICSIGFVVFIYKHFFWADLVFRIIYHSAVAIFGSITCREIWKSVVEMNAQEIATNRNCVILFRMTLFLVTINAVSSVISIVFFAVKRFGQVEEVGIETGVCLHESLYSVTIMIAFFVCFPRLRPRLNSNNEQPGPGAGQRPT